MNRRNFIAGLLALPTLMLVPKETKFNWKDSMPLADMFKEAIKINDGYDYYKKHVTRLRVTEEFQPIVVGRTRDFYDVLTPFGIMRIMNHPILTMV